MTCMDTGGSKRRHIARQKDYIHNVFSGFNYPQEQRYYKALFRTWVIVSKILTKRDPFWQLIICAITNEWVFTYEHTGDSRFPCVILWCAVCLFAEWNRHGRSRAWTWSFVQQCSICHVWWGWVWWMVWCGDTVRERVRLVSSRGQFVVVRIVVSCDHESGLCMCLCLFFNFFVGVSM